MSYVVLDAADVIELAEMLEYIVERLDTLAVVDEESGRCDTDDRWPSYDLDQLSGDQVRFVALIREGEVTS
jgi:hypothetical protein